MRHRTTAHTYPTQLLGHAANFNPGSHVTDPFTINKLYCRRHRALESLLSHTHGNQIAVRPLRNENRCSKTESGARITETGRAERGSNAWYEDPDVKYSDKVLEFSQGKTWDDFK